MQNLPDPEKRILRPQDDAGPEDLRSLMEEIREGSNRAFQELVDRLWPELVRFAVWDNGDPDVARDAVQEAFIELWRRRRSWVRSGSPRAYLYRVVRHQLLDEQRKKKVRESWAARERLRPPSSPPDPGEVLAATRAEEAFAGAVSSLPPRRREAFSLVVLRGLSHREAAEVLDVSEQTVANQVSTALREVREALKPVTGQDV
jgi:RNA polymerase sigma factor (sigma-70 family)